MTYNTNHSRKVISSNRRRVFALIALCATVIFALPFCYRWIRGFWPPDLSGCTRIEIRYDPSALDYFLPGARHTNILNQAEKTYLESFETFVVNDGERIKAFAHDLSLGTYNGRARGSLFYRPAVYVTCYRNKKHLVSFGVFGRTVITEYKGMFKYPIGLPNVEIIEPPEMQPFKLRHDCAWNMGKLYTAGPLHRRKVSSYPEPNRWGDAIVQFCRNQYDIMDGVRTRRRNERWISETLVCPSAHEQVSNEPNSPENLDPLLLECHYAMNPNCKPNSQPDMVLLFETKAGWNQHGGHELFTFDNHGPKGGYVLLNDGTVKFIRTKEELQQLRWK